MASVSYLHRGSINNKASSIYVRFRHKLIDVKVPIPYLSCKPSDWKINKCRNAMLKANPNDVETINVQLVKLEKQIMDEFLRHPPQNNYNDWLRNIVNPVNKTHTVSELDNDNVIQYFESYINQKKKIVKPETFKTLKYCFSQLCKYQKKLNEERETIQNIKFSDLTNKFRKNYEQYLEEQEYNVTSINKMLRTLKSVAIDAANNDILIHEHVKGWKNLSSKNSLKPLSPYLSEEELKLIIECPMPNNYLENAKDWLVIACYTGQRVSDFLSFKKENIIELNGERYIEFKQKKTGKQMRIPILKPVEKILKKRDGNFPKQISNIKLNCYIKKVCEIAEINELLTNGKSTQIRVKGEIKNRKIIQELPKYNFITSHVGRKSFATNFYGRIPTAMLMFFTGHTTETQFLDYISKTDADKARSTVDVFRQLGL